MSYVETTIADAIAFASGNPTLCNRAPLSNIDTLAKRQSMCGSVSHCNKRLFGPACFAVVNESCKKRRKLEKEKLKKEAALKKLASSPSKPFVFPNTLPVLGIQFPNDTNALNASSPIKSSPALLVVGHHLLLVEHHLIC